jgi:hypothetical protein
VIAYLVIVKYLKNKWQYDEAVYHIFIDFKHAYGSAMKEIVRKINTCLNETYISPGRQTFD